MKSETFQVVIKMDDLTVNDILNRREVGTIIPLLVTINSENIPVFFVKDYRKTIDIIGDNEIIALKNSIIGSNDCLLFLLMFKFADNFQTTYDIWFNYAEDLHKDFLNALKESTRMVVDFRDENNQRVKSIEIENSVGKIVNEYINRASEKILYKGNKDENIINLEKIERYKLWTIEEINQMLDNIFESYDDIEQLWDDM